MGLIWRAKGAVNMKRTIIAVAAVVLALAGVHIAAVAQPHGMHDEMRAHVEAAANYLNLTTEQRASWDAAIADVESQTAALSTKNRALQKQLHDALGAASPDACSVGSLAIQSHAAMDQLKTAHESMISKLGSYLTPDQKSKFDAYVAAS